MTLTILGSESAGNCYLLRTETETLIIEAGLRFSEVQQQMNYDMSSVVGCIASHEHGDHIKYASTYAKAGIDIYTSQQTLDAAKLAGHRYHPISEKQRFNLGGFHILPFPVPHGVPNFGFLINHPSAGTILFVTDAAYIPNRFNELNHICIEANYEDSIMVSDRGVGRHMSLDTTLQFLKCNDLSKTYNIILLHLSAGNSDERIFRDAVRRIAPGATVTVADKGVQVSLTKAPF